MKSVKSIPRGLVNPALRVPLPRGRGESSILMVNEACVVLVRSFVRSGVDGRMKWPRELILPLVERLKVVSFLSISRILQKFFLNQ